MPKVDLSELRQVRARYFNNLKSCISSASCSIEDDCFCTFKEQFAIAAWYLQKIDSIDLQIGCVSVDVENNPEK